MCKDNNKPWQCLLTKFIEILLGNFLIRRSENVFPSPRRMLRNSEIEISENISPSIRGMIRTDDINLNSPEPSLNDFIQKVDDAVEAINDLCNRTEVDINTENINTQMSELLTEAILNTKEGIFERERLRRISLQFSKISTKIQEISLESRELDVDSVERKLLRYRIEILLKEILLN